MENSFSFQESAAQKAAESNRAALSARQHRDKYREQAYVLESWKGILANANPLKATIIAGVLAMLNMITGWEMNWDLIDQMGLFQSFGWGKPPSWSPLIIALPLEALAFWVASWLGKAYYSDILEWNVWNRIFITNRGHYHRPLAESEERKNRAKHRFWFWLLFTMLVIAQGGIAFHRIQIIENNPVAVLLAVLAFIFLVGEVISGVYFDFLIKKWSLSRSLNKNWSTFHRQMGLSGESDRMVFQLIEKGRNQGEVIEFNGDMKRSIYRHKRRALDTEDYVDEVSIKHATVEVSSSNNLPIADARVVGQLQGGSITDASYTNDKGVTIVYWDGKEDALVSIKINEVEFLGPFSKDQVHCLRLPLIKGELPLQLKN